MKRIVSFIFVLLVAMSSWTATVTATVSKYDVAVLSGEVSSNMTVTFLNDTRSGGRVGAGNTATLVLSGLPIGTVQSITLYMASNSQSGGANVSVQVGKETIIVGEGSYKKWKGTKGFSSAVQPIEVLQNELVCDSVSEMKVTIAGTENSVYLDHVTVVYTPAPPEAHRVVLSYLTGKGEVKTDTLKETEPLAGILLPDMPNTVTINHKTWQAIGWCEKQIDDTFDEPIHWQVGDWYGPAKDMTLYALYSDWQLLDIKQDTSLTDGEYILAYPLQENSFYLSGTWNNQRIATVPTIIRREQDGLYHFYVTSVGKKARYNVSFANDSITIQDLKIHSAYHLTDTHSLFLYSTWKHVVNELAHLDYWMGESLGYSIDGNDGTIYVHIRNEQWQKDFTYWVLFPTNQIPTVANTTYSTLLQHTDLLPVYDNVECFRFIQNGRYVLQCNKHQYDLLGNQIQ
ncbi:MAG: Ig-like domain-containing protein [Paludibacteraceae bacterium]|nr:Ig-like domain-containing protein [Paludibacteraceae bacterium]